MIRCVLLITIDCLRADHVSSYGYARKTTPTLDALAERGILWEQAYSTSSWTKPSVMSLLTGLYPSQHGGFEGIKRSKGRSVVTTDVLSSPAPTLAQRFTAIGWRCGAFVNNVQLDPFTRLDRGFETYLPTAGKADRLIGLFREWLERDREAPAFAYLHFLEAHWPYKPRRRHVAQFGGNRDTNEFRDYSARDFGKLRRAIAHNEATLSGGQLEQMIQMYDGAVRRLDGKIKIVLAILDELGLRDQTAIFVTADHGEEFMEHGQIGHGQSLYDELTHVPLIASIPSGPKGIRRTNPVSHVDLPATLLGLVGADKQDRDATVRERADDAQRDLLGNGESERPVFGELRIRHRYVQTIRTNGTKLHRRYRFQSADGAVDRAKTPHEWTSMYPYQVHRELYDLASDPLERMNLVEHARGADACKKIEADLDLWWQATCTGGAADSMNEVEIDPRVVERLRDLGYID